MAPARSLISTIAKEEAMQCGVVKVLRLLKKLHFPHQ
jgi:hypothetical protein